VIAQSLEQKLFAVIALSSECDLIVVQVKTLLAAAGFASISMSDFSSVDLSSEKSAYQTLCDVVLYDMLKSYVTANVTIWTGKSNDPYRDIPDEDEHSYMVKGLEYVQRQLVYDRFRKPRWSDSSRAPIGNLRQLAKGMGAKVEQIDLPDQVEWPTSTD